MVDLMAFCRWEACVPVHQEEGERAQVPRDWEEDPGGELCSSTLLLFTFSVLGLG